MPNALFHHGAIFGRAVNAAKAWPHPFPTPRKSALSCGMRSRAYPSPAPPPVAFSIPAKALASRAGAEAWSRKVTPENGGREPRNGGSSGNLTMRRTWIEIHISGVLCNRGARSLARVRREREQDKARWHSPAARSMPCPVDPSAIRPGSRGKLPTVTAKLRQATRMMRPLPRPVTYRMGE